VQQGVKIMRKLLVSAFLATATIAATAPAAAQYQNSGWNQRGPARPAVNNLLRQLNEVNQRIDRSARRGVISQREAFSLRREATQIRSRLGYQGRNGLSGREFASLQTQVNRLEQRLRIERRDRDGRRG
jgi:hypothetical protein